MLEEIEATLFTHVIIEIVHTIILLTIPINFSKYAHLFFFLCVVWGSCIAFFTVFVTLVVKEFTFLALRCHHIESIYKIFGTTLDTGRVDPPTPTGTADVVSGALFLWARLRDWFSKRANPFTCTASAWSRRVRRGFHELFYNAAIVAFCTFFIRKTAAKIIMLIVKSLQALGKRLEHLELLIIIVLFLNFFLLPACLVQSFLECSNLISELIFFIAALSTRLHCSWSDRLPIAGYFLRFHHCEFKLWS